MKIFGWQRKLNNDLRYAVVLLKANGQQLIANSLRRKVPVGLHRELNNDLSYAVVLLKAKNQMLMAYAA